MSANTRAVVTRALILISVAAIAVYSEVRFAAFSSLTRENVTEFLERLGPAAPLVHVGLMAAAIVVSPLPSVPLTVAAGMLFGPLPGAGLSLIGALIGAVAAFLIARHLGRELIERIIGRPVKFYPRGSENLIAKIILVSRLIPVVSFDIVSYGSGLTAIPLGKFAAVTLIGMTPLTLVYSFFGSVLMINRWVCLGAGVVFLALFLALPALIRRYDLFGLRRRLFGRPDSRPDTQGRNHE